MLCTLAALSAVIAASAAAAASAELLQQLCSQLLAALQTGTMLTCSQQLARQLASALPLGAAADAREAVEEDEALRLELRRMLRIASAEAAQLARCSPPFAAACSGHPFVSAAAAAAGSSGTQLPAGLQPFLAAVAEQR